MVQNVVSALDIDVYGLFRGRSRNFLGECTALRNAINLINFFFAEYQLYKKAAGHLGWGGGVGMCTPAPFPLLDPLLVLYLYSPKT